MKKVLIILSIALTGLFGCGDDYHSSIPDVPVNFTCDLLQNPYSSIQVPGQFIKVTRDQNNRPVGYSGLIIGQTVFSEGNDFYAFDAACPVETRQNVSVNVKEDGMGTAVCPVCGTVYNLSGGGYPSEGAGTENLKRYNVSKSPAQTLLRVYN